MLYFGCVYRVSCCGVALSKTFVHGLLACDLGDLLVGKNSHVGYRNSSSGRFVTEKQAERRPENHQREHIPNPGRGDTPRSDTKRK